MVKVAAANPLFAALAKDTGQAPRRNFQECLINRDGKVVGSFPSQVEPARSELAGQTEAPLTAK